MNLYLKQLLQDKTIPVIFDYDGTLFEARWFERRINMPNETEEKLRAAHKRGECLITKPITMVIDMVQRINSPIFVLSHIHSSEEYDFKCSQLKKYYTNINLSNLFYATSIEDKINYLERILNSYQSFIYIDDNHQALIKFENHFNDDEHCHFFHASSLFV